MDTVSSFRILLDPRIHEDPLFPLDYMYHGISINNMIQEVRSDFDAQTSACKVVWNMLHQRVMMCQHFINIANEISPYSKTWVIFVSFCINTCNGSMSWWHGKIFLNVQLITSNSSASIYALKFWNDLFNIELINII